MDWHEIIKPATVNLIVGKKGSGKSCLGYRLVEDLSQRYDLLPIIVGFPREKQHLLPENYAIMELEEALTTEHAILLIDEGTTLLPAGRQLDEFVKSLIALSRQREQIVLFIFHASRDIGSKILRGVDAIIVKWPSHRQIEYGSKSGWFRDLLVKARTEISKEKGDRRKYAYVDSEDPEFHDILDNEKPSFWSEELSKAWGSIGFGIERDKGLNSVWPGRDWKLVDTYEFNKRTTYIFRNVKTGEKTARDVLKEDTWKR